MSGPRDGGGRGRSSRGTGLPIGIQLYTLGPDAAKDLDGTLKAVAGIGYRSVELAGFLGRTPAAVARPRSTARAWSAPAPTSRAAAAPRASTATSASWPTA